MKTQKSSEISHETWVSIDPRVYEELMDRYGKPRLKEARKWLLDPRNLQDLGFDRFEDVLEFGEGLFSYWRDLAEYMILKKEWIGHGEPKPTEYLALKCSKRGNDVYARRVKTRFSWLSREIPEHKFFEIRDFQTNKTVKTSLLWVTLTWDRKRSSLVSAWEKDLAEDFNRFMSALRSRYGKIHYLRVWEAFESGYPHVHVVMLFEEAQFSVFPHWSDPLKNESSDSPERSNASPLYSGVGLPLNTLAYSVQSPKVQLKLTFRISEKEEISSLWHSHVDIQAISSLSNVFTYIKKHQEKVILGLSGSVQEDTPGSVTQGFDLENIRGLRSLFLCWIFRKRSFSVSGLFREKILDLISHLHNSNMKAQLDLEGNIVKEWEYTFLGIWTSEDLGIPPFIWVKKLDQAEIDLLLRNRT